MTIENYGVDALRFYLTGASSDGGVQTNPLACLGNYRSSTECIFVSPIFNESLDGIEVIKLSSWNIKGYGEKGYISSKGSGVLTYIPPFGEEGTEQTVPNTSQAILEGIDTSQAVMINRNIVGLNTGYTEFSLTIPYNNTIAGRNITNSERVSGVDLYRAIMLRCAGDYGVTQIKISNAAYFNTISDTAQLGGSGIGSIGSSNGFSDWPEAGFAHIYSFTAPSAFTLKEIAYYTSRTSVSLNITNASHRGLLGTSAIAGSSSDIIFSAGGIRYAVESPDSLGKIQTIANDLTAPSGVSWNNNIVLPTLSNIKVIGPSKNYGLWIHETWPAGATARADQYHGLFITAYCV